jgi:Sensors of blue-light using FAD
MTDTTPGDTDAGPVFRLIYRSHSLISDEERKTELGEIFTTARRKNKGVGITGALVISGDSFVQALEGGETAVRDLYATICEDPRHRDLTVIEELPEHPRTFGRWAMAKISEDGGSDIRLMSNADKGVIVAAKGADPSVTPEQEAVLSVMRGALVVNTPG